MSPRPRPRRQETHPGGPDSYDRLDDAELNERLSNLIVHADANARYIGGRSSRVVLRRRIALKRMVRIRQHRGLPLANTYGVAAIGLTAVVCGSVIFYLVKTNDPTQYRPVEVQADDVGKGSTPGSAPFKDQRLKVDRYTSHATSPSIGGRSKAVDRPDGQVGKHRASDADDYAAVLDPTTTISRTVDVASDMINLALATLANVDAASYRLLHVVGNSSRHDAAVTPTSASGPAAADKLSADI